MKVSVVIPIYNAEKFIEQLLESLKKQTFDDVEFILINDGSKDSTDVRITKKLDYYGDSRFRYFTKKNTGVSDTRNFGIKKAIGKYIIFVDADDRLKNNFVTEYYRNIHAMNSDICFFSVEKIDMNGKRVGKLSYNYLLKNYKAKKITSSDMFNLIGNLKLYGYPFMYISKRELWSENSFSKNIKYQEDLEALARMISKNPGMKATVADGIYYQYVQHEKSALHSMSHLDTLEFLVVADNIKKYLEYHGGTKRDQQIVNGVKLSSSLAVANSALLAKDIENFEYGRQLYIQTFQDTVITDFWIRIRRKLQYLVLLFRLDKITKLVYSRIYS